jgi:hypothetical protein
LFKDVLNRKPDALFMLGDVVNLGFKENRWEMVDPFLNEMRQNKIPVYACLGNHELMSRPISGEKQFQQRFPQHVRTGYSVLVNDIAVVLLNSNFDNMNATEVQQQHEWFKREIHILENNDAVLVIIVGCHHSPFTNSKLVRPSKEVHEYFLPFFYLSSKCKLFVSGHAHVFEHFKSREKDFLTIGGGGGLSHPLSQKEKRFEDFCVDYKPPFHYLTATIEYDMLRILSHRINQNFSGFESGYALEIPLAEAVEIRN